jgi:hypothetical protein
MSLLTDRDAFYLEHRKCSELEGDIAEREGGVLVWMTCSCGGRLGRPVAEPETE